jgi:hypothetical protein
MEWLIKAKKLYTAMHQFFFFLNRNGCKHPKFTASNNVVGDTITKRPEKDKKIQPSPEISTEDLASILERDQVQSSLLQETDERFR